MSRFDPDHYPDRFEFEAYAHRVRADELGEMFHATGAWMKDREHQLAGRLGKFAAAAYSHLHRHSVH
jgi:hypothetical protein